MPRRRFRRFAHDRVPLATARSLALTSFASPASCCAAAIDFYDTREAVAAHALVHWQTVLAVTTLVTLHVCCNTRGSSGVPVDFNESTLTEVFLVFKNLRAREAASLRGKSSRLRLSFMRGNFVPYSSGPRRSQQVSR